MAMEESDLVQKEECQFCHRTGMMCRLDISRTIFKKEWAYVCQKCKRTTERLIEKAFNDKEDD
jgi:hypothetical protein